MTVIVGAEIVALKGDDGALQAIRVRNRRSGEESWHPIRYLFSFIGAEPNTNWLAASGLQRDRLGFLLTGVDGRLPLETSREGVFAVGDVRANSVKRVASAVGDGAQVVSAIHSYLAKAKGAALIPEPMVSAAPA